MQSSPISDIRFRRAVSDPWGLGVAVAAAVAAALLGRGALVAIGVAVAVVAVRVASEYLVPRPRKLELEDSFAAQDSVVRRSLAETLAGVHGRVPTEVEAR